MARPRWTAGSSTVLLAAWVGLSAPHLAAAEPEPPPGEVGQATLLGRGPDGRYVAVPLRHTSVELDVRGLVVAGTVTQQYVNDTGRALQAVYIFPLPHEAAVYDMEIRVGGRVIRSVIQEREEARRTYETARVEGRRAALVEQERPNVFTASVANLMPADRVDVRIRYVEALRLLDGRVRLVFPMVVGPRYVPGVSLGGAAGSGVSADTDAVPDASRLSPPLRRPDTRPGHDLSLRVALDPGVPVANVSSPSHPVTVTAGRGAQHDVRLRAESTLPNRDFVLEYQPLAGPAPQAALFLSRAEDGGEAHALLVAFPPARDEGGGRLPVEMVFVVDVSGSMSGTSIDQARSALRQGLDRLQPGDRFNVVAFSDSFTTFAPVPLEAAGAALDAGRRFVEGLRANGGTEMLPALEHALAMPATPGTVRQIVLITDGCLGNEDQIFTALEQRLGAARLFTVAIGSAPNHHLATRMAEYGRGEFTHIADVSEVARQMGRLLDAMERPALADLSLRVIGADLADVHPARLPDLFPGRPLVLYARMEADARGTLRLEGRRGHERHAEELVFDASEATFHPGITTLWARQRLAERLDQWRRSPEDQQRTALRADIVEEAIAYRLVTRFTSLVAVEERVVNPEGGHRTAVVPTELPAGWEAARWFGAQPASGTADDFLALAALLLLSGGLLLAVLRAAAASGARS